jgi:hypothetical protein
MSLDNGARLFKTIPNEPISIGFPRNSRSSNWTEAAVRAFYPSWFVFYIIAMNYPQTHLATAQSSLSIAWSEEHKKLALRRRQTLTGRSQSSGYRGKIIEHMAYLRICRDLGQRAVEIQAGLLGLLDARSGVASRAGRHWLSDPDSPFEPRPNYPTLFQPCRSVAGRFVALFAALLLVVSGAVQAAKINARSASFGDVSEAINSAAKGDTVIVPAGTASWTKTLVIDKPITLIGQTTVNYTNETADDETIILDDVSRSTTTPAPIIHAIVTSGNMAVEPTVPLLHISGFTFRGSVNTTKKGRNGAIMLAGTCPAVRINNCHFDRLHQISVYTFGWIYGVMDNCLHTITNRVMTGIMGMPTYNGQKYGDGSWMEDAHWGSYKFFFTENNVVHNLRKDVGNMDAKRGARYVVRYSKLYDCSFIQTHGTEGDRDRGCRAIEFYNNICKRSTGGPGQPGGLRSGNILFHDNKYMGVPLGNPWVAAWAARMATDFQPWGLASGDNSWDHNDPRGVYVNGTAFTASVVDSQTKGSTSFYVAGNLSAYNTGGYSIQNTRTGLGGIIWSAVYNKTANKTLITCDYNIAWETSKVKFNIGDSFQICRVLRVLDQMGLGKGTLCSTPKPLNGAVNEASYAWNNTQANGTKVIIHSGAPANPTFVAGRDYFNSTPPFPYKPYTYPHPLVTP